GLTLNRPSTMARSKCERAVHPTSRKRALWKKRTSNAHANAHAHANARAQAHAHANATRKRQRARPKIKPGLVLGIEIVLPCSAPSRSSRRQEAAVASPTLTAPPRGS